MNHLKITKLNALIIFVASGFSLCDLCAEEKNSKLWTHEQELFNGKLELNPWQGLQFNFVSTPPRDFYSKLGGVFTFDYLQLDPRNRKTSGGAIDRAVLRFEGHWRKGEETDILSWRVAPDLKGVDTRGIETAWLSYTKNWDYFQQRLFLGLFEMPLSFEHSIPEERLPFSEYGFPAYLDSRTDVGIRFDGSAEDKVFSYDFALTFGEGFNRSGERASGERIAGRWVLFPMRLFISETEGGVVSEILRGVFGGSAFSYTFQPRGKLTVSNPLGNELFTVGRLKAKSSTFLYYAYGIEYRNFLFIHEAVRGGYKDLETALGDRDLDNQITAWSMSLSWMVTGESYNSSSWSQSSLGHGFSPKQPLFKTSHHSEYQNTLPEGIDPFGWGAFELAARYSNGDIDREFFVLGFTDYTTSSQEFRSFTFAINWYPIQNIRWSLQVVRTLADQRPVTFDSHGRDTSYLIRMQYVF